MKVFKVYPYPDFKTKQNHNNYKKNESKENKDEFHKYLQGCSSRYNGEKSKRVEVKAPIYNIASIMKLV